MNTIAAHSVSPIVSVITPFYNAERWLSEVVSVTKAQTLQNFEHLFVNDSSTDGGLDRLHSIVKDDSRYKIFTLATNSGPGAARNVALASARGQYIAFLDVDDCWLPEKLEFQVHWMKQTGYVFTFHDYRFMSHDGRLVGNVVSGPEVLTVHTLHTKRGVGCLTVMLDKQQVANFKFAVFLDRSLPEDYVAWLSVIQEGYVGHRLPKDLARYRISKNSRSANKLKAAKALWNVLRSIEKLMVVSAIGCWFCYVWEAFWLHRRSKPKIRIDTV